MADLARIKRNVAKMASMNAPEEDIDGYIASEGVTIDDVRNYRELQPMTDEQRAQAREMAQKMRPEKTTGDKVSEFLVTNPIARQVGFGLQGIANAGLNPAGYVARAAGIDTKPLEAQTAGERATELAGQYGYDTAALVPLLGLAAGAVPAIAPYVAPLIDGGVPVALATSTGGAIAEGITNPTNDFERFLANMAGGGLAGGVIGGLRRTATNTAGGLKEALPNERANAALSKGITADKGVARTISKEAPAVYDELNADMTQALNKATGRKLDIEQANQNARNAYENYIAQNADYPVYTAEEIKTVAQMPTKGKLNAEQAESLIKQELGKIQTAEQLASNAGNVKQNAPSIKNIIGGLNNFKQNAMNKALAEGAAMSDYPLGSLDATHKAQGVLNDMINASYDSSNPLKPRATTETSQLMSLKKVFNELMEPSGVKPLDARISKAKTLRSNFEKGYNFRPSETKFDNLGLNTARDKKAFLQGRLAKLQDNVLSEGGTNLADAVIKDQNTLKKLMPKKQFDSLMNTAGSLKESFNRLKSIEGQANRELLKDIERGGSPWRENIESEGSLKGRALDIIGNALNKGSRRRLAEAYLNPEISEIRQFGGVKGALKGAGSASLRQALIGNKEK